MNKIAASELGKTAISAAKSAGNELAASAISTARDIAIEKGKQFLEKSRSKNVRPVLSELNNQVLLLSGNEGIINKRTKRAKRAKREKGTSLSDNRGSLNKANKKSKEMLSNLVNMGESQPQQMEKTTNINNMLTQGHSMTGSAIKLKKI